jgi:hypothetical protein
MESFDMSHPIDQIDKVRTKPLEIENDGQMSSGRSHRLGEVYLGLVHYTDGVEGARRRINAAERYLSEFGVATECGFGRRPSHQDVMRLIKLHADIIDDARKS